MKQHYCSRLLLFRRPGRSVLCRRSPLGTDMQCNVLHFVQQLLRALSGVISTPKHGLQQFHETKSLSSVGCQTPRWQLAAHRQQRATRNSQAPVGVRCINSARLCAHRGREPWWTQSRDSLASRVLLGPHPAHQCRRPWCRCHSAPATGRQRHVKRRGNPQDLLCLGQSRHQGILNQDGTKVSAAQMLAVVQRQSAAALLQNESWAGSVACCWAPRGHDSVHFQVLLLPSASPCIHHAVQASAMQPMQPPLTTHSTWAPPAPTHPQACNRVCNRSSHLELPAPACCHPCRPCNRNPHPCLPAATHTTHPRLCLQACQAVGPLQRRQPAR